MGTGSIGMRYLKVLERIDGVRAIAIPKRPHRLRELAEQGIQVAQNIQDATVRGATQCIIASDTGEHLLDGLDAARHGLDILVEKPMAVNARDAQRLCDEVEKNGRRVFVACCLRFSKSLDAFRSLLESVGRLHAVRIECQSYLPDWRPDRDYRHSYSARACDGGVLRDLIHELDYAGWLYGWPDRLQAKVRNLHRLEIEAEEAADLLWEIRDGCVVSIRLDYLSRPPRRRMCAYGERGTLEWDGEVGAVTLSLNGKSPQIKRLIETRDEMLRDQVMAFLESCSGRDDSRLATGDDGVRALAICDAARQASQQRIEVLVPYHVC